MKVCYSDNFNVDLGILNLLHPFDGSKFRKVYNQIFGTTGIEFVAPPAPIDQEIINEFVDPLIQRFLRHKEHIIRALEVPNIPFLSYRFLDNKVLTPMRWGVAGTIASAEVALTSGLCWNLAGGYHHASQHSIEGFCIYNDIGICYQELIKKGLLTSEDKILIIDTDAHHGNGNARTFMDNHNVHILDIYNERIYPTTPSTRDRVDIPIPLEMSTTGQTYLKKYQEALPKLQENYRLAFIVAGTDVLATDKLGGLSLVIGDVVEREKSTLDFLRTKDIPTVVLSGGGYSKDSAKCIAESILHCQAQI